MRTRIVALVAAGFCLFLAACGSPSPKSTYYADSLLRDGHEFTQNCKVGRSVTSAKLVVPEGKQTAHLTGKMNRQVPSGLPTYWSLNVHRTSAVDPTTTLMFAHERKTGATEFFPVISVLVTFADDQGKEVRKWALPIGRRQTTQFEGTLWSLSESLKEIYPGEHVSQLEACW